MWILPLQPQWRVHGVAKIASRLAWLMETSLGTTWSDCEFVRWWCVQSLTLVAVDMMAKRRNHFEYRFVPLKPYNAVQIDVGGVVPYSRVVAMQHM